MELLLKPLEKNDPISDEVQRLYESSFPENERRPFSDLFSEFYGKSEKFAFLEGDRLAGMAVMLSFEDITHILYLAVPEELRGSGYGSQILTLLRDQYPGQRIIADLERPEEGTPNEDQREKRITFYRKNGYEDTDVAYRWEGEDYLIMSNGGNVTGKEFGRFWHYFFP